MSEQRAAAGRPTCHASGRPNRSRRNLRVARCSTAAGELRAAVMGAMCAAGDERSPSVPLCTFAAWSSFSAVERSPFRWRLVSWWRTSGGPRVGTSNAAFAGRCARRGVSNSTTCWGGCVRRDSIKRPCASSAKPIGITDPDGYLHLRRARRPACWRIPERVRSCGMRATIDGCSGATAGATTLATQTPHPDNCHS